MYRKEIIYDRETRDYAKYLDGELVGFARTYHAAETELDQLVFELMLPQARAPQESADDLEAIAGDVGGIVAYVNGKLTIIEETT